jgi:hypothetical protein
MSPRLKHSTALRCPLEGFFSSAASFEAVPLAVGQRSRCANDVSDELRA